MAAAVERLSSSWCCASAHLRVLRLALARVQSAPLPSAVRPPACSACDLCPDDDHACTNVACREPTSTLVLFFTRVAMLIQPSAEWSELDPDLRTSSESRKLASSRPRRSRPF
jgi:hypothetical protein